TFQWNTIFISMKQYFRTFIPKSFRIRAIQFLE
ncbi:unnamed protein product, partial [Rotaria sp. Silwood2]